MASNQIPDTGAGIISLGTHMHTGLADFGEDLGITQITATSFQTALDNFTAAEFGFNAARSAKQTASYAWTAATTAVYDWLQVVRPVLAGRFGNRWSPMWAQAGFIGSSTKVPQKLDQQLALALSLANFFGANPTYQVPAMNVSAAQATTLRQAALTAQTALSTAIQTLKTKETAREDVRTILVGLMRSLIKILGATLSRDDQRWEAFGLYRPAANTTPGQPLNLTVGLDYTGKVQAQCDPVPLAQRYRWRLRLVGQQEEYRLAASSTAPSAFIGDVLPGQTIEIVVQAVNGGSQGVASAPVIYTRPPLASPAPEAAPAPEAKASASRVLPHTVRPGNGNGHAARSR